MPSPLQASGLLLAVSFLAQSATIAPCTEAPGVANIIPLSNAASTYCVSDYGWSDTWFVGIPFIYDLRYDVLSGDDSPNLRFGILGGDPVASGRGWISPVMDMGTLGPTVSTGSAWTVVVGVHPTGTGTVASEVHHPLGMNMVITTSLSSLGSITQNFHIVNTSSATFTGLRFADYFNFHPNGSVSQNSAKGSISYDPLVGLMVTGTADETFISNGTMRGQRVADAQGCGSPVITESMIEANNYVAPCPIAPLSLGPGDVAGALAWDLAATLSPGEAVDFAIFKQGGTLPDSGVPEPATPILLASGFLLLARIVARRRPA